MSNKKLSYNKKNKKQKKRIVTGQIMAGVPKNNKLQKIR
jgi:hypothetical protein